MQSKAVSLRRNGRHHSINVFTPRDKRALRFCIDRAPGGSPRGPLSTDDGAQEAFAETENCREKLKYSLCRLVSGDQAPPVSCCISTVTLTAAMHMVMHHNALAHACSTGVDWYNSIQR